MMRLIDKAEVAEILQTCVRTVDRLRRTGQLAYVRVGRRIRFTEEDVRKFIETSRRQCPVPESK